MPIRALAALFLVATAVLAPSANALTYSATGTITLANAAAPDACTTPQLQGKSSSCVGVSAASAGKMYSLSANAPAPVVGLKACFYTAASTLIDCDEASPTDGKSAVAGVVPAGAARLAVSAVEGASMRWLFMVS